MRFRIIFADPARPQVEGDATALTFGENGVFVHQADTGSDFYPYAAIFRIEKYPVPVQEETALD
jgi:hypothetical protein